LYFVILLATSLSDSTAPAQAQPQTASLIYPEVSEGALLGQILPKLKRAVRDPYSIRDFTLCSPRGLKLKDGRPDRWSVFFSFNAKNAMGGYVGIETWMAVFRGGRLSGQLTPTQIQSTDGLMGMLNRKLQRELEACAPIDDQRIQAMLSAARVSQ